MSALYESCAGCGAANPSERCFGCFHDFGPGLTAPSNANTSGLGDVGLSETYRFAYESIRNGAPGLSDATCAAIARSINMKVSLAANDRATAAEARADRLAKGLLNIAEYREEPGGPPPDDEMRSIARAALQQETQK